MGILLITCMFVLAPQPGGLPPSVSLPSVLLPQLRDDVLEIPAPYRSTILPAYPSREDTTVQHGSLVHGREIGMGEFCIEYSAIDVSGRKCVRLLHRRKRLLTRVFNARYSSPDRSTFLPRRHAAKLVNSLRLIGPSGIGAKSLGTEVSTSGYYTGVRVTDSFGSF